MHFSTRFVWRLCVPAGLTMDSDPPIWEPNMPAHFFVNACPTFHLCSSSFPGPPAVEGPSAERTASLAVERIGPVPQTWIGDRPTDAQWHKQHFLCCPPVRVWSFSLWVGLGHTDGLDNRAARTNRTPFGTPVDDDTEASTSRPRRGVGSASDQPSSTIGTVYDRLGLPAGPTDVRPMGSVQNCGIPVHTVSYRRHHAEGDALPFPPADRSSRICPRTT
ncbi:hypothetical protein GGP85_000794 [Salinibacter ruber]|uniref:Uncharacterized protein n=1 Tax=Salinibacter ruber TaxID=146919 RepID=A0A9X2TIZ8_9BACT|nr:hypothetical protein [Salinibacter ruber]MCS3657006.1 hypothetical protein [Salinibacter ruber]MCS3661966.1 hypothetical protein [Salinibacter ruber]MCS3667162.1 hypothetical protein [Salinibacter ruber]MCS3711761.1 hypothetical protein [Salinibacter ruber]